jgi:hypothetical protein
MLHIPVYICIYVFIYLCIGVLGREIAYSRMDYKILLREERIMHKNSVLEKGELHTFGRSMRKVLRRNMPLYLILNHICIKIYVHTFIDIYIYIYIYYAYLCMVIMYVQVTCIHLDDQ